MVTRLCFLSRLQCGVRPGGCVTAPCPAAGTGEAQGNPGLWGRCRLEPYVEWPGQPEDSGVLGRPGTGTGRAEEGDLPYAQAALPGCQPPSGRTFPSDQAFWHLRQSQTRHCWDLYLLSPCCRESWFQALSQSVLGRGILHKLCPRPWFPVRLGLGMGGGGSPTPAAFSQPFSDLDFVMLDDSLHVRATYISGELVWQAEEAQQ